MAKLEDNFKKLENCIDQLENEELPLEEAFKVYETGMKLLATCNKDIDKVEKKLVMLQNGSLPENSDTEVCEE